MASGILRASQVVENFQVLGRGGFHLLEAVDEVQNLLDQFSVQNKEEEQQPATLERAQNVIQLAMERLEEEFHHLLVQNNRSMDPDWLFDSMAVAGSFKSSFDDDHHHIVDDAAIASEISSSREEDAAGDEDEDFLGVHLRF
jgi:hypothetical protein